MKDELKSALDSAKRAGDIIMDLYWKDFETYQKEDRSPVTEADLRSQESLFENLKGFGYGFVGEESENKDFEKGRCWIVDPLDGTKDFLNKTDDFSVMIGLVEEGEVMLGVVYAPAKETFYFAQKGKGAYRKHKNEEPKKIKCSDVPEAKDAKMVVSRFHLDDDTRSFMERANIKETVPTGSIGLKLSLIAEGKADIYLTTTDKTYLWDVCAGDVILKEAGGRVADTKGGSFLYRADSLRNLHGVVASNGELNSEVLSVLEK